MSSTLELLKSISKKYDISKKSEMEIEMAQKAKSTDFEIHQRLKLNIRSIIRKNKKRFRKIKNLKDITKQRTTNTTNMDYISLEELKDSNQDSNQDSIQSLIKKNNLLELQLKEEKIINEKLKNDCKSDKICIICNDAPTNLIYYECVHSCNGGLLCLNHYHQYISNPRKLICPVCRKQMIYFPRNAIRLYNPIIDENLHSEVRRSDNDYSILAKMIFLVGTRMGGFKMDLFVKRVSKITRSNVYGSDNEIAFVYKNDFMISKKINEDTLAIDLGSVELGSFGNQFKDGIEATNLLIYLINFYRAYLYLVQNETNYADFSVSEMFDFRDDAIQNNILLPTYKIEPISKIAAVIDLL